MPTAWSWPNVDYEAENQKLHDIDFAVTEYANGRRVHSFPINTPDARRRSISVAECRFEEGRISCRKRTAIIEIAQERLEEFDRVRYHDFNVWTNASTSTDNTYYYEEDLPF